MMKIGTIELGTEAAVAMVQVLEKLMDDTIQRCRATTYNIRVNETARWVTRKEVETIYENCNTMNIRIINTRMSDEGVNNLYYLDTIIRDSYIKFTMRLRTLGLVKQEPLIGLEVTKEKLDMWDSEEYDLIGQGLELNPVIINPLLCRDYLKHDYDESDFICDVNGKALELHERLSWNPIVIQTLLDCHEQRRLKRRDDELESDFLDQKIAELKDSIPLMTMIYNNMAIEGSDKACKI